jgi:hypothetical protein
MDIAKNEPKEVRVGLTWQWDREDLVDHYPAPTWTLTYYFKNAAANFTFAAAANGSFFRVSRTPAQTAALSAGSYDWIAVVSDGTAKHEVDRGRIELLPDYTAAANLDDRSHARRVLEAIEAVIEGRASKDQQEYTINGRSLKLTPIPDLLVLKDRYAADVAKEDAAEAIANGAGNPRVVRVRFQRA